MREEFSVAIHDHNVYFLLLHFVPTEMANILTEFFKWEPKFAPRVWRFNASYKFRLLVANFFKLRLDIV
ncbi:hypothetical protein FQK02_13910 [Xanthomonas vasicola]|uniref:Uncharacterized protein n=1 Tax=Xanthomonas vasicola pv. vasculorum NCPPB 890 TaxID=1184265 RepID=A0A837AQ05_XANVA|nr:hypothetical protein KW5_0102875 [Xanthomonas vasicola pv. vasculorum NCPPB 1326]KFA31997.1 hypothetical protein KWG_0108790 [Xanthomonas vasicola pv. vasculorum NCPPB 1381]TWQ09714.1 hypothetical protein FQK02_13910 [Xanthomonas vasicola]